MGVDVLMLTDGCYSALFAKITQSPKYKAVRQFSSEETANFQMSES